MFAHIKTHIENPRLLESGFALDRIMHLRIKFDMLALTRGRSHIKLPEWIPKKKAVIIPENNDGECFKWAVIATLYHEETAKDP